jgi:hypothetical protein
MPAGAFSGSIWNRRGSGGEALSLRTMQRENSGRVAEMATNAATKQRGRPFKAGQSGNPTGKRLGTRNKATMAAQALLDGEADALTRRAVELALEGNMAALRLCLERLLPPR